MRKIKVILMSALLALFIAGCSSGNSAELFESGSQISGKTEQSDSGMEVHFIDVGQGDATLIKAGDHAMLVDAGDNSEGTAVQSYLNSQGIEKLDYVIGTHPDADHIGGLLRGKTIDRMLLGKGPQGIARMHAHRLVRDIGYGIRIGGMTCSKYRRCKHKEQRERDGDRNDRRGLQGSRRRSHSRMLSAIGLGRNGLKTGATTFDDREGGCGGRLELKGEVSLDHIGCIHLCSPLACFDENCFIKPRGQKSLARERVFGYYYLRTVVPVKQNSNICLTWVERMP